MTLPSFNAEQSLYQSTRHYRSAALASVVGRIRPSAFRPPGSYKDSCSQCNYDGPQETDTLTCYCTDECGQPIYSELGYVSWDCPGVVTFITGTVTWVAVDTQFD